MTDVFQFAHFVTSDAPQHVAEVEQWIRGHAWAWFRDGADSEDRRLLVGDIDGEIIAVSAHVLVDPSTRYLMVLAVEREHRGQGIGRLLIGDTVADMQERTPGCGIYGLVDPANDVMRHLAAALGASPGDEGFEYLTFMVTRAASAGDTDAPETL